MKLGKGHPILHVLPKGAGFANPLAVSSVIRADEDFRPAELEEQNRQGVEEGDEEQGAATAEREREGDARCARWRPGALQLASRVAGAALSA